MKRMNIRRAVATPLLAATLLTGGGITSCGPTGGGSTTETLAPPQGWTVNGMVLPNVGEMPYVPPRNNNEPLKVRNAQKPTWIDRKSRYWSKDQLHDINEPEWDVISSDGKYKWDVNQRGEILREGKIQGNGNVPNGRRSEAMPVTPTTRPGYTNELGVYTGPITINGTKIWPGCWTKIKENQRSSDCGIPGKTFTPAQVDAALLLVS